MNLERVTAELRPRGPWEATDLGVRMIRRDAGPVYRVWFTITLPLYLLAMAAIAFTNWSGTASTVYWWLEPLADGPILMIIAGRLFGESANPRAALQQTWQLAKRNWIFFLPPYRFHLARSIAMPLTQLENLHGQARRKRAQVLNPSILNYGIGVTAAYQNLFMTFYIGLIVIAFALLPNSYKDYFDLQWLQNALLGNDRLSAMVNLSLLYIGQTALQPWFVGAGFGLYINCRTQLEAWDIDVAFQRIVQRRKMANAGGNYRTV